MAHPLDFSGKTVLVVGGTSGIGNGIAHGFRESGASVHVTGTRASADDYSAEDGSDLAELVFHSVDVSQSGAFETLDLPDLLDVVVLCQGTVRYRREEFEREGWDAVMEVNLNSLMECSRAVRPKLAKRGGALIIVSSVGAYHAMIGNPAYAASKAGAVSLVGSLAQAWAGEGIRVNGIAPGLVPTKLTKVTTGNEQRAAGAIARIPVGRMGTPADMASAALFLASPLADYVVGQTIRVDGGMTLS
ncbi:SDR family NAD(P)-dependent oxidoreductase [Qipengyuania qiaonensis]|uniref:SDR family oxidoreductase n=1 Tax=Qipengyuania qiaonensis TaxID=2867240 RepID=A0ABS7JA87_9SPHN|nr:SDR family oxidoreductase [Qipengyuania qiaonensis]MBX7484161.1 SDR family oxidoreductase [Qipengyuania qiaonensis]